MSKLEKKTRGGNQIRINRRKIAAALVLALIVTPLAIGEEKPNFIIIFTDDQGYGDLGCYGASGFDTPNLDGLAAGGIRFTDFYVPATVCTPSRAALMTGCYPKRVGLHEAVLFPHSMHGLDPRETILPEHLKPLGYRTACIGKWHLGHQPELMPGRQGFDYFYGVPYSNDMDGHNYRNPAFQSPPLPLFENEKLSESGLDQQFLTQRYTEAAVRFIESSKEGPFFLYLAHSMPHLPLHASEKFLGSSERGLYGDVIQEIDWSVGEILKTLEKHGLEEKTLVLFTSDNGPVLRKNAGSAGPLRGGKATTWEGGPRVPCIVSWPGSIPEGEICSALATTMDLLPTFMALAGGPVPDKIDGHNISRMLLDPKTAATPYDALYFYGRTGDLEAVRQGDWKLHTAKSRGWDRKKGPFPVSLYDLGKDIGEERNVADRHPEVVERLKKKMVRFDEELTAAARPARRSLPNIVFILADDMGYGDLGCQNPESKIPTPRLDRLASEGTRFTDAHSASAVCTPTRYSILTGRYCWRTELKKGVLWPWDAPLIEPGRLTVMQLLNDAGYHTACIGKWHLGWDWPATDGSRINDHLPIGRHDPAKRVPFGEKIDFSKPIGGGPTARGFDYYFGDDVPNFPPYCFIENDRTLDIPAERKPEGMFGHAGPMVEGWRLEAVMPAITQRAVEHIERRAGEPFFLFFTLTAPHTPIAPAEDFKGKSGAGAYGDYVHQVDHSVGEILDALERAGIRENTLVLFTSDNGSPGRDGTKMSGKVNSVRRFGHDPSQPWRGIKSDAWEGGHRVPFLARWPGWIPVGGVNDELIGQVDFMAAVAALLGKELREDAGEDSFDMLPVLKSQGPGRETLVHHSGQGLFCLRKGKWKLIFGLGPGGFSGGIRKPGPGEPEGQLYDLEADPGEEVNVYDRHPEVVRELTALLEGYKKRGRSVEID